MTQTRRLAAILAADVAGYSRLMGADEEGTLERLKALRRAHFGSPYIGKLPEHKDGVPGEVMLRSPVGMCNIMCRRLHIAMATNLSIDPALLDLALAVSGERTKKAVVTKALQEFIARRRQKRLLDLMGLLEWDEGFDYKAERSRR
jgi:putative antitoxin of VapBC-like toxin-antitoxin system